MVLLLIDHVGEDQIAFVGLRRLLGSVIRGRAILEDLQVLRGEHVHVAVYLPLFEGAQEQRPKLLEVEGAAGLGGDLHHCLRGVDAFPLAQAELLSEGDADVSVDCQFDAVVAAHAGMRERFLYIHK
jgi:hypothetical protein